MDTIAYELRESFKGTVEWTPEGADEPETVPFYLGGQVHTAGYDIDVAQALATDGVADDGENAGRDFGPEGFVVVPAADASAVLALDEYPPLKRAGAVEAPDVEVTPYVNRSAPELKADANQRGLAGASSAVKADLIAALEEHDIRLGNGTLDELAPLTIDKLAAAAVEREEA